MTTSAVGRELVVYDQIAERAHALNRTAAEVWLHADGTRSVEDLAAHLQAELDPSADTDLVLVTLDGLRRVGLMEDTAVAPKEDVRASRRRFVRKVGTVGALSLLLPMVQAITTPAAADANSPGGQCQQCEGCESCEGCLLCESCQVCQGCECCEGGCECCVGGCEACIGGCEACVTSCIGN